MAGSVDPEVVGLVGVIGGITAIGTYILYKMIDVVGTQAGPKDMLPAPPPYPPIPRFLLNKDITSQMGSVFKLPK